MRSAIQLKYLSIIRQQADQLRQETGRLLDAAPSRKDAYKIMQQHWKKFDKMLAKINAQGMAEIAALPTEGCSRA